MSDLTEPEIRMRIKRQKFLIEERRAEYRVFGMTPQDIQKDAEIQLEIHNLESQLTTSKTNGREK